MSEPKLGRPGAQPSSFSTATAAAMDSMPEDQRSLEARRLAREQARADAEMKAQAELARGVIYGVLVLIGIMTLIDLLLVVSGQSSNAIRLIFDLLIMYGIYQGKSWARIIVLALCVLTMFLVLPSLGVIWALSPMLGFVTLLIPLGYLGGSIALFMKPATYHFQQQ
jgi:hypothetical protein